MSTGGRTGRGGALLAATLFALAPLAVQAEPGLTPAMQTKIASALADGTGGPAQCPAPGTLSSMAGEDPDLAPAIAGFTAKRLRAQDDVADREVGAGGAGDSRCSCAAELTGALAAAAPAHAGEVRDAFAGSFPGCDGKVTEAIEQNLTGAPAGPGIPLSSRPDIPNFGPYGDPISKCKTACSAVEPPAADAASQTTL